ncbi:hypothetical protein MFIFM68171_07383 [Madurella fahalii]|uniref:Uncharacterized protein n=1 Tax=Madurella fahalii TaxID=1157608 RepID=A0ABQ0GHE5_9PEZI
MLLIQEDLATQNDKENAYFQMMLRCIPMVIRNCAFEWRFHSFESRAWILTYIDHLKESPVMDRRPSWQDIITGRAVPDQSQRREIFDWLSKGEVFSVGIPPLGLTIDKA